MYYARLFLGRARQEKREMIARRKEEEQQRKRDEERQQEIQVRTRPHDHMDGPLSTELSDGVIAMGSEGTWLHQTLSRICGGVWGH